MLKDVRNMAQSGDLVSKVTSNLSPLAKTGIETLVKMVQIVESGGSAPTAEEDTCQTCEDDMGVPEQPPGVPEQPPASSSDGNAQTTAKCF
eukprot:449384-Amphidinium_carterae.3